MGTIVEETHINEHDDAAVVEETHINKHDDTTVVEEIHINEHDDTATIKETQINKTTQLTTKDEITVTEAQVGLAVGTTLLTSEDNADTSREEKEPRNTVVAVKDQPLLDRAEVNENENPLDEEELLVDYNGSGAEEVDEE